MSDVSTAVKQAIESSKDVGVANAPPPPLLPPNVALNICKMLERVQVTGMEAIAWVEAYQKMQQFALQGQAPGVLFGGLGK